MQTIDQLRARLAFEPREPRWHYMLARVHLDSLENTVAAEKHFCRAVLEAKASGRYGDWLRAMWMRPGQEGRLEQSLSRQDQQLRWRAVLSSARKWIGLTPPQRARAFMAALHAIRMSVRAGRMPLVPGRGLSIGLSEAIKSWVQSSPIELIAVFSASSARRVAFLNNRLDDGVNGDLWYASMGSGRVAVYGSGVAALEALEALLRQQLKRVVVKIYVRAGRQQLLLHGRQSKNGFHTRFFAALHRPPQVFIDAAKQ
jgi:hypothetical protein